MAALAPDQVAGAARQQRRGRLAALDAGKFGAAAYRRGARVSRSKLQSCRVRPCIANTQLAPPRARSRPLPPSRPHMRLDCCAGRRRCPGRRPLGLAACARCGRFAPSLYPRPHHARTGIERRRRRGRCAPGTAGQGVCRACLPRAHAAVAACRRPCAPSTRKGRGRRAADAAPALFRHPHGRRAMASSGARWCGARCAGLPLHIRLHGPRYPHGFVLARGPAGLSARCLVGLSASGRSRARLSLWLSARPRVPLLRCCSIRVLAQAHTAILRSGKAETCGVRGLA
jgi:hypothetical protein